MNPIKKKELETVFIAKPMNDPRMVEYLMPPRYTIETYSTGQEKRRARRKQERKGKKK